MDSPNSENKADSPPLGGPQDLRRRAGASCSPRAATVPLRLRPRRSSNFAAPTGSRFMFFSAGRDAHRRMRRTSHNRSSRICCSTIACSKSRRKKSASARSCSRPWAISFAITSTRPMPKSAAAAQSDLVGCARNRGAIRSGTGRWILFRLAHLPARNCRHTQLPQSQLPARPEPPRGVFSSTLSLRDSKGDGIC